MKSTVKIPLSSLKHPVNFLALGFGSGLMPKAPGTFGTLAAIPVYMALVQLPFSWYLMITLLLSFLGIAVCEFTSRQLRVHDHPGIVFDEIAGYIITMLALPLSWTWMLAGFVVFRFFDILKPWPISWLDRRVHGGLGIMLDDVLAGVMACAVLNTAEHFL